MKHVFPGERRERVMGECYAAHNDPNFPRYGGTEEMIEAAITRMCESFSRGLVRRGEHLQSVREIEDTPVIFKPKNEQKRLITEALLADPKAAATDVAFKVGTGTAYVYEIRKRLRAEGRI